MSCDQSPLESIRIRFSPQIPSCLADMSAITLEGKEAYACAKEVANIFPYGSALPLVKRAGSSKREKRSLKVGAVFSGGQAPGGHNVIAGLWDSLSSGSELIGFLEGPSGILSGTYKTFTKQEVDAFRNTGGFDLLGSGRTKIETEEQFEEALKVCNKLKLDGLVIIGGDDSNTNAALLAEYFHKKQCPTCVIGIPKTIDGDLKNEYVPISFGFDTASKVYAEMIGNLERDALSAKKYYHFVRLMGRTASHIALECALLTHPNLTIIAEEVFEKKMTLKEIVSDIVALIIERAALGKSYGVIIIPEGLIESIPEVSKLIGELNEILSKDGAYSEEEIKAKLTLDSQECFFSIPSMIQKELLLERDPHGNVQVSLIETERLLLEMVSNEMKKIKDVPFHALPHFFGYEGRSAFPSNFDASYCYTLGAVASLSIESKLSGYMCFVSNLHKGVDKWDFGAVPLASLTRLETRKGKLKPVIEKALVDLKGKPFTFFTRQRALWRVEDKYCFPGPIQFNEGALFPPLSLITENE